MPLKVIAETEVLEPEERTAAPSETLLKVSPALAIERKDSETSQQKPQRTVEILREIREILSAKAAAMAAMAGALALTGAAMYQGTWMALGMSISYDVLVFIPLAFIAYLRPRS